MLDFGNFNSVVGWVVAHGYVFIFLLMSAEGPITTAAAGFAAALGFFNPVVIFGLSIAGDLIPDTVYYLMGYYGRLSKIEKLMQRLGITQSRMNRMEELLKKHFKKTLVAIKVTPVIGPLGYMIIGYLRLSFATFIWVCGAVTIPKSIIFLLIGYYFGQLYNVNQYIRDASLLIPILAALGFLLYLGYGAGSRALAKKFGKV